WIRTDCRIRFGRRLDRDGEKRRSGRAVELASDEMGGATREVGARRTDALWRCAHEALQSPTAIGCPVSLLKAIAERGQADRCAQGQEFRVVVQDRKGRGIALERCKPIAKRTRRRCKWR